MGPRKDRLGEAIYRGSVCGDISISKTQMMFLQTRILQREGAIPRGPSSIQGILQNNRMQEKPGLTPCFMKIHVPFAFFQTILGAGV